MTENAPTPLTPIEIRNAEVAQYNANIAMYAAIAANLPSTWPAHLLPYKTRKDRHDAISEIQDLADVELLSDLWTYESAQASIRTETLEMRKAQAILNALTP
jgi:hypothetical protein